ARAVMPWALRARATATTPWPYALALMEGMTCTPVLFGVRPSSPGRRLPRGPRSWRTCARAPGSPGSVPRGRGHVAAAGAAPDHATQGAVGGAADEPLAGGLAEHGDVRETVPVVVSRDGDVAAGAAAPRPVSEPAVGGAEDEPLAGGRAEHGDV